MDERTLRIIVVSASLAAIGVFREPIMRWLHKMGYTGTGLGKRQSRGDERKPEL